MADKQELVMDNIENIIRDVVTNAVEFKKSPTMTFPKRDTKTGTIKDLTINFGRKDQRHHFTLLLHVMAKLYMLSSSDQTCTVRDLFYEDVTFYKQQQILNKTLDEIWCAAKIPRFDMPAEASAKGLIAGNLQWLGKNKEQCSLSEFNSKGMLISTKLMESELSSKARYILFVEKDAVFQKLLKEDVFLTLGDIILITGKGYADRLTRRFLTKLSKVLRIPTFAFVDADPYGMDIAANLRWGSSAQDCLSDEPEIAFQLTDDIIPELIWLGILPSQFRDLSITHDSLAKFSDRDKKKLALVRKRAVKHNAVDWIHEIDLWASVEVKAEMEVLDINPGFMVLYLKQHIQDLMRIIRRNSFRT